MVALYSPGEIAARLGSRARDKRIALKMRQSDLAKAAGLSTSTIPRFEGGDANLSIRALAAIAIALGDADELAALFGAGQQASLDEVLRAQQNLQVRVRRVRRPRRSP